MILGFNHPDCHDLTQQKSPYSGALFFLVIQIVNCDLKLIEQHILGENIYTKGLVSPSRNKPSRISVGRGR